MSDATRLAEYVKFLSTADGARLPADLGLSDASGTGDRRPRLVFVVNDPSFFLSHRLPLALAARRAGADVHVATQSGQAAEQIAAEGLPFHRVPINRSSVGLLGEIQTVLALFRLYRALRPDIVHHVTIKPVIYGSIAARLARIPAVVNAITGLGYVFAAKGARAELLRAIVRRMYKFAFDHPCNRVIFQNPDDQLRFLANGIVRESAAVLIRGSGVSLEDFPVTDEQKSAPVVLLASRMLWHKGVGEFVEAARRLRNVCVGARFVLVGDTDSGNPSAIPRSQLERWHAEGVIEWWGHRDDMPRVFAQSHIVCLASEYGEGVPKVLIEAAASGRPIVTTDSPGCREIVRHGENGLLVPVRDAASLAAAIHRLMEEPKLRREMGLRGREIVEAEFSVEQVVKETLALYRELLS